MARPQGGVRHDQHTVSPEEGITKLFLAALAAAICLTTSAALAQEVSPPAVAGVYRGHLTEIKGARQSDFTLDLTKEPGTLVVYEAVP